MTGQIAMRVMPPGHAEPRAGRHWKGPSSRIHPTLQEARRHQQRGDNTVDLGCPSDTMIQGFRVAGLLSLLDCQGARDFVRKGVPACP